MALLDQTLQIIIHLIENAYTLLLWFLIAAGWSLPLIVSLAAICRYDKGGMYKVITAICFGISILNGYFASLYLNLVEINNFYLTLLFFVSFSAGPTYWIGLKVYINPHFQMTWRHLYHFLPGAVVSVVVGLYLYGDSNQNSSIMQNSNLSLKGLMMLSYLYSTFYFYINTKKIIRMLRAIHKVSDGLKTQTIFVTTFGFLTILAVLLISGALLIDFISPLAPLIYMTLILITLILAITREPQLLVHIFEVMDSPEGDRRLLLTEDQATKIGDDLDRLMATQHRYRDPDLSLPLLAQELNISAHQLSEYLNVHRGLSFAKCINKYRVEELKVELIKRKSTPVLELAMASGFNSKSTFNAAFSEIAGTTPSAWRKVSKDTLD